MPADYSRVHRLLRILTLVQSRRGWNAARLSRELHTAERTIYRDLKVIEAAGIPLHFDESTQGYVVRRDFFMPSVQLTLDESLAMVVLAEQVGVERSLPFTGPAQRAAAKLRASLPHAFQDALDSITPHIEVDLASCQHGDGFADVYEIVRSAIASRRALQCRYESIRASLLDSDNEPSNEPFLFKPYCLFFGQRAWYVVGHHDRHDAVRNLKLSRFSQCDLTDRPYGIPEDFSLRKHLGKAWRMIGHEPVEHVELHFDRQVAETVADTHWHDTQRIDWHEDGGITFHCDVAGLEEIIWWVLSYGPNCRVIRPKKLANRVAELAKATTGQYHQHALEVR